MATSLSISGIKAGFSWGFSKTTNVGSDTSNSGSFGYSASLSQGTGANAANKFYADEITIAGGASVDLDLAGVLVDVFSATTTFTKIRLIYIEVVVSDASTGDSISVGGSTAAFSSFLGDATDKIKIKNGGCFQLACKDAAAYAVTATTGDILKIINLDSTLPVVVRIGLAGE